MNKNNEEMNSLYHVQGLNDSYNMIDQSTLMKRID
jgi:hypothetical protein